MPVINTAWGVNRQSLQNSYGVKRSVEKGNCENVINGGLFVVALPGAPGAGFGVIYIKGCVWEDLRRTVTGLEQWVRNMAFSIVARLHGLREEDLLCKSEGGRVKRQE